MQFKVPQFIDIEDKIFGPFTFKQFSYLAGGGGLAYLSLKLLPFFFGVLIAVPIVGFALALAFVKMNEKPFINMVESFIKFHSKSRLYLWKKEEKTKQAVTSEAIALQTKNVLTESKLKTLSWSLNVLDPNK